MFERFDVVQVGLRQTVGNAENSSTASDGNGAGDLFETVSAKSIDNGDCSLFVGDACTIDKAVSCSKFWGDAGVHVDGRQKDVDDTPGTTRGGSSFVLFLAAVSFTGLTLRFGLSFADISLVHDGALFSA